MTRPPTNSPGRGYAAAVPRLIHLNGPSGIGKSTVARLYADRHPGVLNLDTDQVVSMIGGWRDDFWATLAAARPLAISMAETHLRAGHDVVMPQLVTRSTEVEGFEAACDRAGAGYREIVLTAERQHAIDRLAGRATGTHPASHIDAIIAREGGTALVERIHDDLNAYLLTRPHCAVVVTDGRDPDETYGAVIALLAGSP